MGLNGVQYDEEGKEKENIEDSEDENNGEFTSPFLNDYLNHIIVSKTMVIHFQTQIIYYLKIH